MVPFALAVPFSTSSVAIGFAVGLVIGFLVVVVEDLSVVDFVVVAPIVVDFNAPVVLPAAAARAAEVAVWVGLRAAVVAAPVVRDASVEVVFVDVENPGLAAALWNRRSCYEFK